MRTGSRIRLRVWKHLCVTVWGGGKQSIYFSKFRKYFSVFAVFCTINRYFEYRNRIRCIELYMGTWFKEKVDNFSKPLKNVPEV